jgi:hypothetical protein
MCTVIPHSAFTFSRKVGNTLVAEHSTLAAQGFCSRAIAPSLMYVKGQQETVLYERRPHKDVYDAGREDLVAMVYQPVSPRCRTNLPDVHLLND